jgi:hypothetical protein
MKEKANARCVKFNTLLTVPELAKNAFYLISSAAFQSVKHH